MIAPQLQSEKANLPVTRVVDMGDPAVAPLQDGQVLFAIEKFSLTANNITYGLMGTTMHWWETFPVDEQWGHVPVWGFARVLRTNHPAFAVGDRYYGFMPMGCWFVVQPEQPGKDSFHCGLPCKQNLALAYKYYLRVPQGQNQSAQQEAMRMALQPLYMTGYALTDFLTVKDAFAAEQILISSASSKTGYSLAQMLHQSDLTQRVIGLTSPRNADFVRGMGCYDEVVLYDDIEQLPQYATVFVDMAGSQRIRARVHEHFGDTYLKYSCSVGASHWTESGGARGIAGPRPVMFFAPGWITERAAAVPPAALVERANAAWPGFVEAAQGWTTLHELQGMDALRQLYNDTLAGRVSADALYAVSLQPAHPG